MATILVVEDDAALRSQLARLLVAAGHATLDAPDGRRGLAILRESRPDAVICDIAMPEMDGLELLQSIRAEPALAATPVLLLSALTDHASVRRGMTAGADDSLSKPFAPSELLDAVAGLLKKRDRVADSIESTVALRLESLRMQLAASAAVARRPEGYGLDAADAVAADAQQIDATVLFADIRNFTALAQQLSSTEVAELLGAYFEHSCPPVLLNGGVHLKFIGDGLMSLFSDEPSDPSHFAAARRAVTAALGIALAAHEFREWVQRRFAGRGLPPFAIGIGLHAGEVTLCRLGPAHGSELTPIGDTVNVAARLETASKELGWTVVASTAVLRRVGIGVETAGAAVLALRGRSGDVEVAEVTGLAATGADQRHSAGALGGRVDEVRTAIKVNSALSATVPDGSPVTVLSEGRRKPAGD